MQHINKALSIAVCLGFSFTMTGQAPFFVPNKDLSLTSEWSNLEGYYFLSPVQITPVISTSSHLVILDDDLNVVFYKAFPRPKNHSGIGGVSMDFKIHKNGLMSFYHHDGQQGAFYLMDSTFRIVDTLTCINKFTDSHGLQILKDGSYYLLCNDSRYADLSNSKYFNTRKMSTRTEVRGTGSVIQHISKNKKLLFEWNAFDHCRYEDEILVYVDNDTMIDWGHGNNITITDDGNLLLTLRNFWQVLKISRKDGSVLWRLGGNRSDFTFINDSAGFNHQHDAELRGNLLSVFDNGKYHNPPLARALIYKLDFNHKTAEKVYEYKHHFHYSSDAQGSFQLLPNGYKLISWGKGNDQLLFDITQLDRNDSIMFELDLGRNYQTFRAFYGDIPWELKRPVITCFKKDGKIYLDAGPGYKEYIWSNGEKTRIIEAQEGHRYQVFVNQGIGLIGSRVINPSLKCNL
ncbi:MAG: hypothetical protein KatS3mg031_1996 [Chitinophagales bacterium]|nr:MAG: hypothetical protein KatS3mg031_1996 [Chitinophagales bacterium]